MSEYWIAHSSGPWKKHKYVSKKGSGSDAIYIYGQPEGNGRDVIGVAGLKPKTTSGHKTANEKVSGELESWAKHKASIAKKVEKLLEKDLRKSISKAKKVKKAKKKLPKIHVNSTDAVRV